MPRKTKSDKYVVYKHTNIENGKVYIGITSTNIECRSGHNGKNYYKNPLFYKAIKKYGWDNFLHEVLYDGLSLTEATELEIRLIASYNSANPKYGYNISTGGECGRAGVPYSEEERSARRKMMSGKNNPCFGKFGNNHPAFGCKHTDESKRAASAANTGRVRSDETRKRISDSKKSSGAWVGSLNPMSGKTYGSAPHARMVCCVETGEVFDSVKRAAESIGAFSTSITAACAGRQQTCGGFHWVYIDKAEVTCRAS